MICFAWSGFPQYAARCIRAVADSTKERVAILATRPKVPVQGMDDICGGRIKWIDENEGQSIIDLLGECPRCIFLGGWNVPAFVRFRDEVRANGGMVIALCDNNWMLSPISLFKWRWWKSLFVECVKALRFRVLLLGKYDAFLVPGKSSSRVLRFYGVPKGKIYRGMYTADSELFFNGPALAEREKNILFVGQFVERKNVRRLIRAFLKANVAGEWKMDLYGSGPLREELIELAGDRSVKIHSFLQPQEIAAKYREARIFCLPSLNEHWGLVVHEAALSGCVLLLGDKTGAADDLLGNLNGKLFDPYDDEAIYQSLKWAMSLTEDELKAAQKESLRLAKDVSIGHFVKSVCELCRCRSFK